MSRVTSDTMTIEINGTDYSNFIDTVDVSGGDPEYSYIPVWNGRKKRAVTGYKEFNISIAMLYDSDNSSLIDNLSDSTIAYTIVLGDSNSIQRTFNNMYFMSATDNVAAADGLQMIQLKFTGEGIPANKT